MSETTQEEREHERIRLTALSYRGYDLGTVSVGFMDRLLDDADCLDELEHDLARHMAIAQSETERAERLEAALRESRSELTQLWEDTLSCVSVITERGEREVSNDEDNQELHRLSKLIDKCDGALAQQDDTPRNLDGGYDMSIHSNPDHTAWARLFKETFPDCEVDEDTMATWFANAMMAKHDSMVQERPTDTPQPEPPDDERTLPESIRALPDRMRDNYFAVLAGDERSDIRWPLYWANRLEQAVREAEADDHE